MSRIHEALKKAELERTTLQPVEVAGASAESRVESPQKERTGLPTMAVVADSAQAGLLSNNLAGRQQIEALKARCANPVWRPDLNVNVFMNPVVDPHATEQFRTLRSRLYQLRGNQRLHTVLITSPLAAEGKTFITGNLAQAIVRQSDRSVLIIDADLRRSRMHVPLGAPLGPGLSDYLRGQASEEEIIQHGQEGNLFFIAGGNVVGDPSELLSNGRLKELLDRVSGLFDWILIDSPPCLPVADANVLADFCDGLLLVVRAGSTPAAVVQRAGRELQGRNVVGVVLNAVDKPLNYGPYYASGPYGDNQSALEGSKSKA